MNELGSINIAYAIACDDIRQEANGKFILIGVYSGNIGLSSFPAQIGIGFWMIAKPSKKGEYHIQFRVQILGESDPVVGGEMTAHVRDEQQEAVLIIPPIPILIPSPSDLTLQYREGDSAWNIVCAMRVRLALPAPPS